MARKKLPTGKDLKTTDIVARINFVDASLALAQAHQEWITVTVPGASRKERRRGAIAAETQLRYIAKPDVKELLRLVDAYIAHLDGEDDAKDRDTDAGAPPTLTAELRFWGGDPGSLAVDEAWRLGDLKAPPATIRHAHSGWSIHSELAPTEPLDAHVGRILAKLAKLDLSQAKVPATDVELSVAAYRRGGATPVIWVSADHLEALAALGASLDIDTYC